MNIFTIAIIAIVAMATITVIAIILIGYLKAAPDEAIIISGLKKRKHFLIGRAGIKIPFFERSDYLFLGLIPIIKFWMEQVKQLALM